MCVREDQYCSVSCYSDTINLIFLSSSLYTAHVSVVMSTDRIHQFGHVERKDANDWMKYILK